MHLNDRKRLCPLQLGQHCLEQQIKIFAEAARADLRDERCDEAADKGGRELRAGRIEEVAGDSHHLVEIIANFRVELFPLSISEHLFLPICQDPESAKIGSAT
jgi:hypothetical protein